MRQGRLAKLKKYAMPVGEETSGKLRLMLMLNNNSKFLNLKKNILGNNSFVFIVQVRFLPPYIIFKRHIIMTHTFVRIAHRNYFLISKLTKVCDVLMNICDNLTSECVCLMRIKVSISNKMNEEKY